MDTAGLPARSSQFWTLLDLSTGHLRPGDIALLEQYRGADWEGERHRDPGQTLFLSPVVGGWLITTAWCLANGPEHMLSPEQRAELGINRQNVIKSIREEGFSEEFIALFRYAYEHGAAEIRFHRDAGCVPGFPRFDLEPGGRGGARRQSRFRKSIETKYLIEPERLPRPCYSCAWSVAGPFSGTGVTLHDRLVSGCRARRPRHRRPRSIVDHTNMGLVRFGRILTIPLT